MSFARTLRNQSRRLFDGVLIRGGHFLDGGAGFLTAGGDGAPDVGGPAHPVQAMVSSPVSASTMNHAEKLPPMEPESLQRMELQRHAAENLL